MSATPYWLDAIAFLDVCAMIGIVGGLFASGYNMGPLGVLILVMGGYLFSAFARMLWNRP